MVLFAYAAALKQGVKRILVLVGLLFGLSSFAAAGTVDPCGGSMSQLDALGSTGCSIGSTVFSDFTFGSTSGVLANGIDVSSFNGTLDVVGHTSSLPPGAYSAVGLQFTVNLSVPALQYANLQLSYQLNNPSPVFGGSYLSIYGSADELATTNLSMGAGCGLFASLTVPYPEDGCALPAVSSLDSSTSLGIYGGNSDSYGAGVKSFTELYITETPEPSMFLLLATSLVGAYSLLRGKLKQEG